MTNLTSQEPSMEKIILEGVKWRLQEIRYLIAYLNQDLEEVLINLL
jgi:hypothetical protein